MEYALLIVVLAQVVWVLAAWVGVRHSRAATGQIYCPQCGAAIALSRIVGIALPSALMGNGRVAAAPAPDGAPLRCESHPTREQARPSHLLKRGWSRILVAEDADGNLIPSQHPRARRWSIIGAGLCAFEEGSPCSPAYFRHLRAILRERYGSGEVEPSFAAWNAEASRNWHEILGVSLEVERRMKSLLMPDGCDDTTRPAGRDTPTTTM